MQRRRCVHVGLEADPSLTFIEPTERHRCYAGRRRQPIELSHQAALCLTPDFEACSRFVLPELGPSQPSLLSRLLRPLQETPGLRLVAWVTWAALAIALISYIWLWLVPGRGLPSQGPPAFIPPSPSPTQPPTQTPTVSATATVVPSSPTPAPPPPTLPPGLLQAILVPAGNAVGWVFSGEHFNHLGDRDIHVGILGGRVYHGAVQFGLASIPLGSKIEHATLELMGLNAENLELEAGGTWAVRLLSPEVDEMWASATYEQIRNAPVAHTLAPTLSAHQLAERRVNVFTFTPLQLTELEARLESGLVSFRLDGPNQGADNLFTWDTGHDGGFVSWPVLRVIYEPPPTPTSAASTATPAPVIVANTPSPGNAATAQVVAAMATARASLQGTPMPMPLDLITATPRPTATGLSTATSTPAAADVGDEEMLRALARGRASPMPTAFPPVLLGKIAFHSDRLGQDRLFVMDPDGSDVAPLADDRVYEAALAAQVKSSGGLYVAQGGWGDNLSDVFLTDRVQGTTAQITWMISGTCRDPAWSPDNQRIAFASSQDGDDEVFLVLSTGSAARQMTHNELQSDGHPSWSPDGARLVYGSSGIDGGRQIWVMNLDGTGHQNISDGSANDWDPVWIKPAAGAPWATPTSSPPALPPPPTRSVAPSPASIPTLPPVEVTITGVSKRRAQAGVKHDDIEIYGVGFHEGVSVLLTYEGRAGIFASDVSLSGDSLIRCKFDLRDLQVPYTDQWTLRIENPDGQAADTWLWISAP